METGINRKKHLIEQIDVPTKPLYLLLRKLSLGLLGPQLFTPIFNAFSLKVTILCIVSLLLSIVAIIASKHPSNSYSRNVTIKTGNIKSSEAIETFSVVVSILIITLVFLLYVSDLISHIQI